jgi:phosphoribosylformylglycinamidine synthase-like protein
LRTRPVTPDSALRWLGEGKGADPAQGGDPRSSGQGGGARVGRLVELETDDAASLPDLCEKLLANPLIEDYEIVTQTADDPAAADAKRSTSRE